MTCQDQPQSDELAGKTFVLTGTLLVDLPE